MKLVLTFIKSEHRLGYYKPKRAKVLSKFKTKKVDTAAGSQENANFEIELAYLQIYNCLNIFRLPFWSTLSENSDFSLWNKRADRFKLATSAFQDNNNYFNL